MPPYIYHYLCSLSKNPLSAPPIGGVFYWLTALRFAPDPTLALLACRRQTSRFFFSRLLSIVTRRALEAVKVSLIAF